MTEKTIEILKSLKLGEKYSAHKPLGKQEIEEQSVLNKLYNLEILKRVKNSYSVRNAKYLSKFIELQDFEKLVDFIENTNESEKGIKGSLEYKILKHLEKNNNGDFINMKGFIENEKRLETTLLSLSKKPEKYISVNLGSGVWSFGDEFKRYDESLKAKIEFEGIKYLNEIESKSENNNINISIENYNHGENKGILIQGSRLEKSPIKQSNKPNELTPTKKNPIFSKLIEYWWQLLIGLISGILLILFERGIIDIGL